MTPRRATVMLVLAGAVALAMGASVRNGFVFDDVRIIVDNPLVTNPAQWVRIPLLPYWQHTLWRPLTVFGFALQWAAGGGHPWLFHLVSLLGYTAVAWLLVRLLQRLGVNGWAALATGAIFAVHPVHVEVVANGVGQSELWCASALLASALLYLTARDAGTLRSWRGILPVLLAVAAAMAAKEQGFVAVVLLAGLEWLVPPRENRPLGARLLPLLPVVAVTAAMLLARTLVTATLGGEAAAPALLGLGFGGRCLTFLATVAEYARLLVWPAHLQGAYDPPALPAGGPFTPLHAIGLAVVIVTVVLFVASRRRAPVAAFGLWWGAVALAPVSNVLVPTGLLMAERVFFLPSIGFVIAAGAAIDAVASRVTAPRVRFVLAGAGALWLAWATIRSARRVPVWHDDDVFADRLERDAPTTYFAALAAGIHWQSAGQPARAEAAYRHAIDLWPHDNSMFIRLGQLLRSQNRCADAEPILVQGLGVDTTTDIVRSQLLECQLALRQWSAAERTAEDGVARGDDQFRVELERIRRAAAADSVARAKRAPAGGS